MDLTLTNIVEFNNFLTSLFEEELTCKEVLVLYDYHTNIEKIKDVEFAHNVLNGCVAEGYCSYYKIGELISEDDYEMLEPYIISYQNQGYDEAVATDYALAQLGMNLLENYDVVQGNFFTYRNIKRHFYNEDF